MQPKAEDHYYTRGSYRLHYRVTATGANAPTVLLLHGWAGNYTVFEPLVALLNARGYSTIVPDLRGHGLSDKHRTMRDYELREFVEDVHALLGEVGVTPARPVIVLGYSAGGTIALQHELAHPGYFREFVLVAANHRNPMWYWGLGWLSWLLQWPARGLTYVLKFDRRKRYKHIDLVKIKSYWGSVFEGLQSMPVDVNLRLMITYIGLHVRGLERITAPVLILRGKGDPLFTGREAREMVRELTHAQANAVSVPQAGHYLVSHHGDLLVRVLEREGALPHVAR
ncbi:MAG: alpha/beta hydrolase [Candidatus Andersenbacteria bacterium]